MEQVFEIIQKNPTRNDTLPSAKERFGDVSRAQWGAKVHRLDPPRLVCAWRMAVDPLMGVGGSMYRATETRDWEFKLQGKGTETIRGKRKLSKKAIGEALSAAHPNADQQAVIAGVLYECERIQTVMFDMEKKSVRFYPEDLRAWSADYTTVWVDSRIDTMLEWPATAVSIGKWCSDREEEGWVIPWPEADLSMDDLKAYTKQHDIMVRAGELGGKVKKGDYARTVGRSQAIRHLSGLDTRNHDEELFF